MRYLVAIALLLTALVAAPGPAQAQEDTEQPPVTITETEQQPVGGIIVKPNSGAPPENAGDRGGALQITLFALIVAFVGVAVFSIRRSSRKALAAQGRP